MRIGKVGFSDTDWDLEGCGGATAARPQISTGALPQRSSATGSQPKSDTSGTRVRAERAMMSVRGVISALSGAGFYVPLGVCAVEAPGRPLESCFTLILRFRSDWASAP